MALAAVAALLLFAARPAAADLPELSDPGTFQDVPLATALPAPTTVKFVPTALGNRMFVALKSGVVLAYDQPQDPNPIQVIDLSAEVHDFWDRGLLGMALSPGFNESGGTMYLLYARDAAIGGNAPRWGDDCPSPPGADEDGCVISGKLVQRADRARWASPTGPVHTIIQDQWCQQFPSHSVGTVAFGPDGMLYVSAGEGANFNAPDWGQYGYPSVNPCHDPYVPSNQDASEGGALRAQDVETDADPAGLSGAVLRIDPVTGAAASGNPFSASADLNKRKVIAYGLRNPFRFTFRPGTSDIWLGDVGWTQIEEIDKVTPGTPAENFGWPCKEGNQVNGPYQSQTSCDSLSNETPPQFTYDHSNPVVPGDNCLPNAGSVISGLAFYGDGAYPNTFNNGLFFTDYARNCIWFAPAGGGGEPNFAAAQVFARGVPGVGPVDLQTAPNGNLVYVFHDQTFGEIHEVRPVDQPTARITITDNVGPTYGFSATSSTPSSGATYEWDLDDNGSFEAVGPTQTATWNDRSARTIRLRVTANGISDTTSARISANNTIPHDAKITKVSVPAAWTVGDRLRFSASAIDPDAADQGHLTYTWVMTILHCPGSSCHEHPVQTVTGPTATFIAPSHDYPSRLQITLRATDTLGFSSPLATLELQPRVVTFTTRANLPQFTVRLNGVPGTSVSKTLIAGTAATVSTTSPQVSGGQQYFFARWSDGDRRISRTAAPRSTSTLTAIFLRKPVSQSPPGISGTAKTSRTLTAAPGVWGGDEVAFSHQWLRCATTCTPIPGATGASYRTGSRDRGKRLAVRVTGSNGVGSASAQSGMTAAISDGTAPSLKLSGAKKVRLGDGRLKLTVRCPSERCTLRAGGLLKIEGRKATKTRTVKKTLRAGKKATLRIRLSKKQLGAAKRALRTGRSVSVEWAVTAADKLSNRRTRHFTVKLRR